MADATFSDNNRINKYDFQNGTIAVELDVLNSLAELAGMLDVADDIFQDHNTGLHKRDSVEWNRQHRVLQTLLGQSRDLANALHDFEDRRRLQNSDDRAK